MNTVNGQRSTVNGKGSAAESVRCLLPVACCLFLAQAAAAQVTPPDTVLKIRPEARSPDSAGQEALPPAIVAEVLAAFNDSLTTKVYTAMLLPAGSSHEGPIAVFRGTLRVSGEVIGRVTIINGDLIIDSGATVAGDVLVVGGQIIVRPGGSLEGRRREYRQHALLVRTSGGLLAIREPPRTLGDMASARTRFTTGRFETELSIETSRTYNRVEGLPIVFGPTVVRTGLPNMEARLDLRAIAWTAPDRTNRRADFGYSGRLEFKFGESRRLTAGAHVSRLIVPIEELAGDEVCQLTGIGTDVDLASVRIFDEGTEVATPAFDVTPARLVTGIVTERGVAAPSDLAALFPEHRRAA